MTDLFSGDIAALLGQYAANPAANWKAKDAAIYLVIALTLKGSTSRLGATQTNSLVNLADFCQSHVLPELQAANPNPNPRPSPNPSPSPKPSPSPNTNPSPSPSPSPSPQPAT